MFHNIQFINPLINPRLFLTFTETLLSLLRSSTQHTTFFFFLSHSLSLRLLLFFFHPSFTEFSFDLNHISLLFTSLLLLHIDTMRGRAFVAFLSSFCQNLQTLCFPSSSLSILCTEFRLGNGLKVFRRTTWSVTMNVSLFFSLKRRNRRIHINFKPNFSCVRDSFLNWVSFLFTLARKKSFLVLIESENSISCCSQESWTMSSSFLYILWYFRKYN